MSVNDDMADSSGRTDDTPSILENFDTAYQETYRRKVIDKDLLKQICDNIDIPLKGEHIELLAKEVRPQEVMDVLEFLPPGVSPGKDHVMYNMYGLVPDIVAPALARIANEMAKGNGCPEDFLINEV